MSSDIEILDSGSVGTVVAVSAGTVVSVATGTVVAAPLPRALPGPPSVAATVVSTTVVSLPGRVVTEPGIVVVVSVLRVPACNTGRNNNSP